MKRFRKVLVVLLAILVPVSIGFGFNFFSKDMETESAKQYQTMTVDGTLKINEKDITNVQNLVPGDKICDGVTMNITSSAVSLLRVKIEVNYAEANSTNYQQATDIEPITSPGDNWLKGSDGYYYYTQGVKDGNNVVLASEGIYFNGANDTVDMNKYQGKKIKVKAEAELVQAKHGVFAEKWGLTSDTTNQTDKDIYTKLLAVSNTQGK